MKKLYIETYGCQMNVADSEVVASVMKMAGYETTDSLDEADAVFLNTCSVRENAENKIYKRLEALAAVKRKRKSQPQTHPQPLSKGGVFLIVNISYRLSIIYRFYSSYWLYTIHLPRNLLSIYLLKLSR